MTVQRPAPPTSCAACGHRNRPGARFCEACGSPLAPQPATRRAFLSVLAADLVGSTALQEQLDPETARPLMARWSTTMRAAILEHGGHVEHFAGDGVIAAWGVPEVREDDAIRAVRAAWAMRAALAALNDDLEARYGRRLRMRSAVHSGEAVVSPEGFLVGDTINTAVRLEQNAPEDEVLIGPVTRRIVRDQVRLEPVAPVAARGKRDPVPAWRLASVEAPAAPPPAPFVGRAEELGRLRAAYADAVASRRCRLALVVGSPGLGKTRLAAEFAAGLEGEAQVVRGGCEPYGEGMTYAPVAQVLRDLARIGDGDDVAGRLREVLDPADPADPQAARTVAAAAGLLGAGEAAPADEIFLAIRRLAEAAARRRPLVVVLDDLHWAEPQLLDLVEHLAEWVGDAPVLLLGLTRPELREERPALTRSGAGRTVVELDPLGPAETRALVGTLAAGAVLPPRVYDTGAGNPLFLSELVRMLIDDGTLRREHDGWAVTETAELDIPPTISVLLTGRLGRLPTVERGVVERAAVIGTRFYRGAVAELAPESIAEGLDGALETLDRKELVRPEGTFFVDEPVYRFHHGLIRDAAYRGLLKAARAELHERFADWLERKTAGLAGEQEEVIAFHLEQAHEHRKALGTLDAAGRALGDRAAARLASAGRLALARDDFSAAANLLGRAEERAAAPDPLVRFDRCTALLGAGDLDGAAAEVAALEGLPEAEPVAAVAAAATEQLRVGSGPASKARLDAAIDALRGTGRPRVLAHALTWKAHESFLGQGRHAVGEALLEEALAVAQAAGDEREVADVRSFLPLVALWGPSPLSRAAARCEEVLTTIRAESGSHKVEAQTLCVQGLLEAMRGDGARSAERLAAARATFTELALTMDLVDVDLFETRALLIAGRAAEAESVARRALAGPGGLGLVATSLLAQALVDRDPPEAFRLADDVLSEVTPELLRPFVSASGVRALVLAARGEHEAALADARAAVAAAAATDAAVQRAESLEVLARVLASAGDAAAAREAAGAALAAYTAKEHTVGAARVAATLTT